MPTYDLRDLVTPSDIAERFGVSRAAFSNWQKRYPDMPSPVYSFGQTEVWYWPEIESWHRERTQRAADRRTSRIAQLQKELARLTNELEVDA